MLLQGCVRLQLGYGVGARLQTGNVPRRRDRHIAPRNQHLVRCLMLLSDLWILLLLVGPRRFLICLFVCRSKMSSRDSSPGATTVVRNTTNSAKTFSASSTCETDLGLNSLSTSGERHHLLEARKLVENRDNRDSTYQQEDTRDPGVTYTVGTDGGNNITARELRYRQSQQHQSLPHGHNHHFHHGHHQHRRGSTSSSTATVITPSTSLQHIPNCSAVTAAPSSSASTLPSNRHRDAAPAANVTSRSRSRLPHSHPPLLSPNDSSASSSLGGQLHGDKIEAQLRPPAASHSQRSSRKQDCDDINLTQTSGNHLLPGTGHYSKISPSPSSVSSSSALTTFKSIAPFPSSDHQVTISPPPEGFRSAAGGPVVKFGGETIMQ